MYINNPNSLANWLGLLSLAGLGVTVCSALAPTFKLTNYKRLCLQITRLALIVTIFWGLIHGLLMTQKKDIDFYNLNTYWVYAEGLLTFNLLIFLAFTFRDLKHDPKKLSYFIYAVLFLFGCHIWQ